MTDDSIPIDQPPTEQQQAAALRQEVKTWQANLSALALQVDDLKKELANLPPGQTAEVAAIQDQLRTLQTELQETRQQLATAREDLSQMRQSAQSVEEDNPTQETRKEGSSDQTGQQVPRPTRASRLGWV